MSVCTQAYEMLSHVTLSRAMHSPRKFVNAFEQLDAFLTSIGMNEQTSSPCSLRRSRVISQTKCTYAVNKL